MQSYGLKAFIHRNFILLRRIKCGQTPIQLSGGKGLYGMIIKVDEEYSEFFSEIQRQKFFKNIILCPYDELKVKRDEHRRFPQAKFFDHTGHIGIIQYAYKHNYFTLEELSLKIRKRVENILKQDLSKLREISIKMKTSYIDD